jgi:hypothetical protein
VSAPYFCANPECVLHVRADDASVQGAGHWAQRPDGIWVGQSAYEGAMYCDLCVRQAIRDLLVASQAPADSATKGALG